MVFKKRASLRMAFFFLAKPNTGNKFEFVSEFRIFVVTPDHGVPSYTHQIFGAFHDKSPTGAGL